VVIVNTTKPVGERISHDSDGGRIVLDFLKRKIPAYGKRAWNLVDRHRVRALAVYSALEKGRRQASATFWARESYVKQIMDPGWLRHGF